MACAPRASPATATWWRRARPERLSTLAGDQGISLSYMEQLFYRLRHAGLVEGIRGPGGGYRLGKPASQISVAQIVNAIEMDENETGTSQNPQPEQAMACMLNQLDTQVHDFLDGISLASLVGEHRLPQKKIRVGGTANLIARMFPPRDTAVADLQPA